MLVTVLVILSIISNYLEGKQATTDEPVQTQPKRVRKQSAANGSETSITGGSDRAKLQAHIKTHLGKISTIYPETETNSDLPPIDLYLIAPTRRRPYYTLITAGMSSLPLHTPPDSSEAQYAELIMCLPAEWSFSPDALQDEANAWPLRWLKAVAQLPHSTKSWLGWGHTLVSSEGLALVAPNTLFSALLLLSPVLPSEDFQELYINEQKTINFWSLIPLYAEEMNYKLDYGLERLVTRFDEQCISELLDPNRANLCAAP
jgi:hypothetical protein